MKREWNISKVLFCDVAFYGRNDKGLRKSSFYLSNIRDGWIGYMVYSCQMMQVMFLLIQTLVRGEPSLRPHILHTTHQYRPRISSSAKLKLLLLRPSSFPLKKLHHQKALLKYFIPFSLFLAWILVMSINWCWNSS